jgi:hypothetical protein
MRARMQEETLTRYHVLYRRSRKTRSTTLMPLPTLRPCARQPQTRAPRRPGLASLQSRAFSAKPERELVSGMGELRGREGTLR